MKEFEWLVYANNADEPIAGFAWKDEAEEWSKNYEIHEVRHNKSIDATDQAAALTTTRPAGQ